MISVVHVVIPFFTIFHLYFTIFLHHNHNSGRKTWFNRVERKILGRFAVFVYLLWKFNQFELLFHAIHQRLKVQIMFFFSFALGRYGDAFFRLCVCIAQHIKMWMPISRTRFTRREHNIIFFVRFYGTKDRIMKNPYWLFVCFFFYSFRQQMRLGLLHFSVPHTQSSMLFSCTEPSLPSMLKEFKNTVIKIHVHKTDHLLKLYKNKQKYQNEALFVLVPNE